MQPVTLTPAQLSLWLGTPGDSTEVRQSDYQVYTSPSTPDTQSNAQTLFAALDTNHDGAVSQSELGTAVLDIGGTLSQANALYSQLANGGDSISESDIARMLGNNISTLA
jgi:Ca2+-binding EF-hand superfamily protein